MKLAAAFSVCFLSLAALSVAQPATFTASANLVTVPVVVTTRDGAEYTRGLTLSDFRILEDGKQQPLSLFSLDRTPVSICIVMDSSGSMNEGHRRGLAIQASNALMSSLDEDDEISLVLFAEAALVAIPWTLGSSAPRINWDTWRPGGSTSMLDAVDVALSTIERARNPQRVIVLITDGFENSSRLALKDLVTTRRQSEAAIYGFGVGLEAHANRRLPSTSSIDQQSPSGVGDMRNPVALPTSHSDHLALLAGDTGGVMTRLQNPSQVTRAVEGLWNDLRNRYLVGYVPLKPFDGTFRRLRVETKRGLSVRSRNGYLASPAK